MILPCFCDKITFVLKKMSRFLPLILPYRFYFSPGVGEWWEICNFAVDMRGILLYILFFLGLSVAGCRGGRSYDSRLEAADSLVASQPDSALRLAPE